MGETESAEQRNESTNAALRNALNFVRLKEQLMRFLAFGPGACASSFNAHVQFDAERINCKEQQEEIWREGKNHFPNVSKSMLTLLLFTLLQQQLICHFDTHFKNFKHV